MDTIAELRKEFSNDYFFDSDVAQLFKSGTPNRLSRLVKSGQLIRLKKGLYVFGEQSRKKEISKFSISNILFGPSFISLESALSYYGLIPEKVTTTLAVCAKRTKHFDTPLGHFRYRKVGKVGFGAGVVSLTGLACRFLIATPERALIDKIYLDYDGTPEDLLKYLELSLRIEKNDLKNLDFARIARIAKAISKEDLSHKTTLLIKALK